MKIVKLSLAAIVAFGASMASADDLQTSLSSGKVTADIKAFYFDGDRDNRTDRTALAIGGILKYESASYYGFKVGAAWYYSTDMLRKGLQTAEKGVGTGNMVTKDVAGNTEMVNSDGSTISTLGEAYLQFNATENTMVKYGRQRLNTPLANDYYNRFLPNSFQGLVVANTDISDTTLLGAHLTKWKYKASDKFIGMTEGVGLDEDVMMIAAINKSIPNTKLQAYYYMVPDVANAFYFQANNPKLMTFDGGSICGAFQYLNQQDAGDAQAGELDTYLVGAKLGIKFNNFKITGMYDQVGDDTIIGSGTSYSALGWSKFINFTDIQIDGEALNAGAVSYGGVFGYDFKNGLKPALKFVHIEQDLDKQAASAFTGNSRPSSDEWNVDIKYKIDKVSKVRVRYAVIDYESTHKNEFDETNVRIIYDYKFSVGG